MHWRYWLNRREPRQAGAVMAQRMVRVATWRPFCRRLSRRPDRPHPRWQSLPRVLPLNMTTMNVSLPEELRTFVDEQVEDGRYGSTSEYVRELIRRDQDRHRLRSRLLDGATSARGPVADDAYFAALRGRVESGL